MEAVSPSGRVLELPYPPSVNHIWRRVGPRTVISREGRRYRTDVCAALAAMRVVRMDGRLAVRVTVCPPDSRRRDLDNVQKALFDALARGGAYRDDSQIDRLEVDRGPVTPGGKVLVEITQIRP
ncbi:MAG: RusA family crossover junction endodeoxyribonuclease [Phycisphaeraceae bacterium]|nr:RusA family crossover junction endodeoxyribonuclease [Phycisphaeraceae bacterium]